MCYFLYQASPLTLSEVRSMLPRGLTAELASSADHQVLKSVHPGATTVARILVGRCSCDLVRARLGDPIEDERHLRERYRRLKVPRASMITALDRHRRQDRTPSSRSSRADQLAKFVAEHARNAGPTLYYLSFDPDPAPLSLPIGLRPVAASAATVTGSGWLPEATLMLVTR